MAGPSRSPAFIVSNNPLDLLGRVTTRSLNLVFTAILIYEATPAILGAAHI
jgi:hypothetical protein